MRVLLSSSLAFALLFQAPLAYGSCSPFGFPFFGHHKGGGKCCQQIHKVPTTIDKGGVYCLARNLSTGIMTGPAIDIVADDVVLDLSGYALAGTGGAGTTATGIRSDSVERVTVKNGTIRGFGVGINLTHNVSAPVSHVIRGVRADGNLLYGMRADGAGVIIRNNQVTNTGGPGEANAWGIEAAGTGHSIAGNMVSDVEAAGQAVGILALTAGGGAVIGNQVFNVDTGIQAAPATGGAVHVRDNTVANGGGVDTGSTGISGGGDSLCKDNMVYNFTMAFQSCTDGGGNTSVP